jgi:hypothetical protein
MTNNNTIKELKEQVADLLKRDQEREAALQTW